VLHSDINLTINAIPSQALVGSSVSLSGTVSDTNLTVTVNGLEAHLDGATWIRTNVPITTIGRASFIVRTGSNGPSQSLTQDIPSHVRLESYVAENFYQVNGVFGTSIVDEQWHWFYGLGGVYGLNDSANPPPLFDAWPTATASDVPAVAWLTSQIAFNYPQLFCWKTWQIFEELYVQCMSDVGQTLGCEPRKTLRMQNRNIRSR
jgi:hypothetical protein